MALEFLSFERACSKSFESERATQAQTIIIVNMQQQ